MWGTRVSNGAVKPNGGETTLGGEVEGCIPTDGPDRDELCH